MHVHLPLSQTEWWEVRLAGHLEKYVLGDELTPKWLHSCTLRRLLWFPLGAGWALNAEQATDYFLILGRDPGRELDLKAWRRGSDILILKIKQNQKFKVRSPQYKKGNSVNQSKNTIPSQTVSWVNSQRRKVNLKDSNAGESLKKKLNNEGVWSTASSWHVLNIQKN